MRLDFVAVPSQGHQLCAHKEGLKQTRGSVETEKNSVVLEYGIE